MTARTTLPQPASDDEFDSLERTSPVFELAIRDCFNEFEDSRIEATVAGSFPVFYVGSDHVVKCFPSLHADLERNECAVLRFVRDIEGVPAPEIVGTRSLDGWSFLLMTRLRGQGLKELWPQLDVDEKERLCEQLGAIVRSLHAVDPTPIRYCGLDWDEFLHQQLEGCQARQERLGLDRELARQIPGFLSSLVFDAPEQRALLHTEIMPAHLIVNAVEDSLTITGMLDFEPAMIGMPEYEFASIGLFLAGGEPALLRAFLRGYGRVADSDLHRRLMGFALLHRYSNVSWFLRFMPPGDSFEELGAAWFRAD